VLELETRLLLNAGEDKIIEYKGSTVQNPSSETNSSSFRPEISRNLCYLSVRYGVHSGPPLVPVLS